MAITFVGQAQAGNNNGNNATINLTTIAGLAQNDIVIVFSGENIRSGKSPAVTGYTQLTATDNQVRAWGGYKFMGATPDTSAVIPGTGNAADACAGIAFAFRGVDTTTPLDQTTPAAATGSGGTAPNGPSITTQSADAFVVVGAVASGQDTSVGTVTNYLPSTPPNSNSVDTNSVTVSMVYRDITAAGAEDPPAWSTFTNIGGWVCLTLALKPSAKVLAAGAGSYTLTGTAATLVHGHPLTAGAGSYTLTGTSASLVHGHPLTAGAGSYALTGTAATLTHKWVIAAGAGSYALTGTDAALKKGQRLTAGAGSYSITGTDASLLHARRLTAGAGSYALTGTDVSLLHKWKLAADAGSYALTGSDVTLITSTNKTLAAGSGSYTLTGTDAILLHGWKVAATVGLYSLDGIDVAFQIIIPPQLIVTDTINYLLKPVNCVLIGDQKEPKDMKYENEQQSVKNFVRQSYGGGFSKGKSSFTTRTDSRGYD